MTSSDEDDDDDDVIDDDDNDDDDCAEDTISKANVHIIKQQQSCVLPTVPTMPCLQWCSIIIGLLYVCIYICLRLGFDGEAINTIQEIKCYGIEQDVITNHL